MEHGLGFGGENPARIGGIKIGPQGGGPRFTNDLATPHIRPEMGLAVIGDESEDGVAGAWD